MRLTITVLAIVAFVAAPTFADSYRAAKDYQVVCLSVEAGDVVWQVKPPELRPPSITVTEEHVVVQSEGRSSSGQSVSVQHAIEVNSGQLVSRDIEIPGGTASNELIELPRNLTTSDGTVLEYDRGNTRHLVGVGSDRRKRIIKELESYPFDIHVFQNLAVFTLANENGGSGGDVLAIDVNTGQRAWKFEGSKLLPKGPSYTAIAIDDDRVLVSADQTLFSLETSTGKLLWKIKLPRQPLLRFDSPWTQFGRIRDRLFIRCYNGLFILERQSGKLLWFFNCGQFGQPWPTVKNDRVYVSMRSPVAAFSKANAVFSGRVSGIQVMDTETTSFQTIDIGVELDRVWKGPSENKVVIETTNTGFGYPFQVGKSYLFYCHRSRDNGSLVVSRLSRTQPVEEARADLDMLGAAATTFNRN